MRHSAETREAGRRLIFEDECTIAEAARTIGVDKKTVGLWFPEAPRMDRQERAEWASYCRWSQSAVGL